MQIYGFTLTNPTGTDAKLLRFCHKPLSWFMSAKLDFPRNDFIFGCHLCFMYYWHSREKNTNVMCQDCDTLCFHLKFDLLCSSHIPCVTWGGAARGWPFPGPNRDSVALDTNLNVAVFLLVCVWNQRYLQSDQSKPVAQITIKTIGIQKKTIWILVSSGFVCGCKVSSLLCRRSRGADALWHRPLCCSSHVLPGVFPLVSVTPTPQPAPPSVPLPPVVSPVWKPPCRPMRGTTAAPHQPNDRLDRPACQPVCLLHHGDMDCVSQPKPHECQSRCFPSAMRRFLSCRYAMAVMNHHVCPVENWYETPLLSSCNACPALRKASRLLSLV